MTRPAVVPRGEGTGEMAASMVVRPTRSLSSSPGGSSRGGSRQLPINLSATALEQELTGAQRGAAEAQRGVEEGGGEEAVPVPFDVVSITQSLNPSSVAPFGRLGDKRRDGVEEGGAHDDSGR